MLPHTTVAESWPRTREEIRKHCSIPLLLTHEGGGVDAERSAGRDGRRDRADQSHGGDGSEEDEGIAGVGLIDDVAEETA